MLSWSLSFSYEYMKLYLLFAIFFYGIALNKHSGPGSVVGIATGYGLDGPGIESRWGRDFPHLSRRPWGPPSLLYNGYQVFPGVKGGRDVTLTPHPLLVPWSWKSRSTLMDNMKLMLICILRVLLSHSFIFFRFYFLSTYIWFYSCLIM